MESLRLGRRKPRISGVTGGGDTSGTPGTATTASHSRRGSARSAAMASDGRAAGQLVTSSFGNGGSPALAVAISGLVVPTLRSAQAFLLEAIDLDARWRRRSLSLCAGCAAGGNPAGPGRHEFASSRSVPARCPRQGPEPGCGAGPGQDQRPSACGSSSGPRRCRRRVGRSARGNALSRSVAVRIPSCRNATRVLVPARLWGLSDPWTSGS